MSKYKCLSVCLIFSLIFSGFFAPAEAALPESQAAQRTVQDSVPLTLQDKLFFVEDIPEIVGTETAAAELYTRRLREEERSLNEIVFRDTSGVNTLYLYSFPVKYVENGEIKDKTLELETLERGGKTLYRSADNDVVTTFSDQISDGIHLQHGEISITLKPEPSVKNSALLKAETAFPAADRKSVAFLADQPVSGNVSLTYMGFSQELLIQERAGQNEFVSRIYTNGLELYQDDFGQLLLRGAGDVLKRAARETMLRSPMSVIPSYSLRTTEITVCSRTHMKRWFQTRNTSCALRFPRTIWPTKAPYIR